MSNDPPVVLLHGWGGGFGNTWASNGWPAAIEAVGRSVLAVNLPGHGGPASADPQAYHDLAGALDAMLPDGPLDVIGYSLGGKLALAIAARHPDRFRTIVIGGVGDNLFAAEPSGEAVADALVNGLRDDAPPMLAAFVRYASAPPNDPAALAAVLRRSPNPCLIEVDLAAVKDVLLVNGDFDAVALPDARLRQALSNARAVRLSQVDHLSLPSSTAFRELALDFLTDAYR